MRRDTSTDTQDLATGHTRAGSAWLAVAVMLVLVLFMLIFVLQNGHKVALEFLWLDFSLPVGVAMLLAAVVGGMLVVLFGAARVVQLRMAARRHRKGHTGTTSAPAESAPRTAPGRRSVAS
jgi:uncharacterized integral membrane protein